MVCVACLQRIGRALRGKHDNNCKTSLASAAQQWIKRAVFQVYPAAKLEATEEILA